MSKTIKSIKGGNTTLSATYKGATVQKSITVNKYTPTITLSATDRACNGNPLYASATVNIPSGGKTAKGTIYYGTTSGSQSYSVTYSGSAVNLSSVSVTNPGNVTVYAYFVPDSTCNDVYNNSGNYNKKMTIACLTATATAGSVSKSFSTSNQTAQLSTTGASGSLIYPTSLTVNNTSTTWSCTTAGVVTIPANTTVGSYTLKGTLTIAANGCYCSGTPQKEWTVTIIRAIRSGSVSCNNVNCGSTVQASVSGNTENGTVTWSTSDTSIATVNSSGVVTGVAPGTAEIRASVAETTNYAAYKAAAKTITVACITGSTGVSTSAMTIIYSSTTGTRSASGNTGGLSVSSSNTNVATVSVSGTTITVTRTGYGSATITVNAAASGCYCSASSTFTVNCNKAAGSVTITDAQPRYGSGNAVATASGATGTVYYRLGTSGNFSTTIPTTGSNNAGTHTLQYYVAESTNYYASGSSSSPLSKTVTIKKATRSGAVSCDNVNCGSKVQASVSGNTENGAVTWGTSNSSIATVNTSGEVTGVAPGTVNITASVAATTNYEAYTATQKQITVNALTGVTGVSTDTMTITYSSTTGTRTVSGNTGTVTVSSSNTNIATVSISGSTITVTRAGYGSATITCTAAASGCYAQKQTTFTVNCNRASRSGAVSCDNVNCGSTKTATVSGNTESGTVTWSTSNSSIATVNTSGVVTGVYPGTVDITASVAQTTNYLAYTATKKTITVNALTGATGVATTAMTITYSATTGTRTVSGNTGTVTVSSNNTSVATVAISGTTITVTRKGYGSATITCSVPATGCYAAASSTFTVTCAKAAGSVTVTNANPTYGTSNAIASVSGATGTVYYRLGTSGLFSTTIPTASGLTANSYTLYYYVAESTNYTNFGTSSSPKSVTVSVAKASNQITISPTSKTIYDRSGYNTFTITVSNYKGTVTASSNNTKATVAKVNNGSFTVTYAGAGSATITITDDGGTNYVSSSATSAVTTKVDTITNSNYSPSSYIASVSIGNGLTAAGGSATVTASASHTAYNLYESGWYGESHSVSDTAKWRITSNGNSRFSHPSSGGSNITVSGSSVTVYNSGTSVSHSSMTTNATTDTVTVTAYNTTSTSATATATKSISNAVVSISLAINGKTNSTSVVYGSSIAASNIVVTGTYTSGSTGTITPTSVSSSDETVVEVL